MRKTSQDGGDSTSITSGFENELKKPSGGIMKTKRNSIKRKVQNFSLESDETVIEPLLQIDKNETANRSAKYLLSKSKTDSMGERDNSIYSDNNVDKSSVSKYIGTTSATTTNTNISRTLHNHMNTNVFGGHDVSKVVSTVKSPVLVEISASKPALRSNQTSSIFTTAKIHADSITKNMEPIQVTPVPIISTVEGNVVKAGISPDYAQNKSIIPSTSSGILKPTCSQDKVQLSNVQQYDGSHLSRSDVGKSDLNKSNTEHMLKKLSDVLDNRNSVLSTESEIKSLSKTSDAKKENVKASSVVKSIESEIVSPVMPQFKPSVSITSDKNIKSIQEQRDDSFKDNIKPLQKIPDIKNIEVDGRITSQNQNASNLKSAIMKDDARKKEDKNISSTSSGSKQLQRQKNAICESDKLDDVINQSLKHSKDMITTTSTSNIIIPTSKSKDNLTQPKVSDKSDTEPGKKLATSTTQVHKHVADNLSFTPITTKEVKLTDTVQPIQSKDTKTSASSSVISKVAGESSLTTTISTKGVTTKPVNTVKSKPTTASFRSDLAIEKKIVMTPSEITKPVTEKTTSIAVTSKEVSPKVTDTVQPKPSSLVQSDSTLKEKLSVKPTEVCKSKTDNMSITAVTTKGVSQKSTTAPTTSQSTAPIKSDSLKENKSTVGSNQISKSAMENTSHLSDTSKGVTQKLSTAPTKSLNSNQSVSVKDSKTVSSSLQINKSLKDKSNKEGLISSPPSTSADKSPTTIDKIGSVKINTTQNLKNAPVSKEKTEVGTSSSARTDLKSTAAPAQYKADTVQNKTLSEDKSKIPITVLPTSNVPVTKTDVKSQPSSTAPSSAKSSIVSKVEPNNQGIKPSSTISSIPTTTNTSTTTLAKSTTQKITSKINVLDKHGKI